jgi:hypothetical protein
MLKCCLLPTKAWIEAPSIPTGQKVLGLVRARLVSPCPLGFSWNPRSSAADYVRGLVVFWVGCGIVGNVIRIRSR